MSPQAIPFSRAMRNAALGLLVSLLPASAGAATATSAAPVPPAATEVLRIMERVADWQLANPIAFDLRWRSDDGKKDNLICIGWDGTVLRHRVFGVHQRTGEGALPDAWLQLARIEADDAGYCALPDAVKETWTRETRLPPERITRIEMLDGSTRGWEMGALYHGLLALGRVSPQGRYRAALRAIGEANHWRLGDRLYHADDYCAGFMYLDFHDPATRPRAEIIAGVQSRLDWIMRHPSAQPVDITGGQDRWTWCDALFMAPPVWARLAALTGDRAYLDFMDAEWWAATAHLYSRDERLFFRDSTFFNKREANGKKIFWSRGNGWVLVALTLVLDLMPEDYPARPRHLALYRDMAARIAALQPADGAWRASLLDPDAYAEGETSSTAFFCAALAWGINRGVLSPVHYRPAVDKAWRALVAQVRADGRLCRIQQPGAGPASATSDSTAPYGVGAFLLAGEQMYLLLDGTNRGKTFH